MKNTPSKSKVARHSTPRLDFDYLSTFCRDYGTRFLLPVLIDGAAYASNGHILVRFDAPPVGQYGDIETHADIHGVRVDLALMLKKLTVDRTDYLPFGRPLPPLRICPQCNGRRYDDLSQTDECGHCDASGMDHHEAIRFGGGAISRHYLAMILELPNILICVPESNKEGEPVAFRFDGGAGIVMQIRLDAAPPPDDLARWAANSRKH
jgi:hypothetical protein